MDELLKHVLTIGAVGESAQTCPEYQQIAYMPSPIRWI